LIFKVEREFSAEKGGAFPKEKKGTSSFPRRRKIAIEKERRSGIWGKEEADEKCRSGKARTREKNVMKRREKRSKKTCGSPQSAKDKAAGKWREETKIVDQRKESISETGRVPERLLTNSSAQTPKKENKKSSLFKTEGLSVWEPQREKKVRAERRGLTRAEKKSHHHGEKRTATVEKQKVRNRVKKSPLYTRRRGTGNEFSNPKKRKPEGLAIGDFVVGRSNKKKKAQQGACCRGRGLGKGNPIPHHGSAGGTNNSKRRGRREGKTSGLESKG